MTDHATGNPDPTAPLAPPPPPVWTPPTTWGPPTSAPAASYPDAFPTPPAAAPRTRSSRFARTALVAVPALLVGAGAATVITLGVVHHPSTSQAAASAPLTKTAKHAATVGTLTATDGTTWTVQTAKGAVTVDLGAKTAYGSKAHPSQESDFHTGEKVRITGKGSGSTVTATRVAAMSGGTTTSTSTTS